MSQSVISLRDVVCPLGGGPCLKLHSMEVQAGEQWVLTGPSGCGKTSLLNILAGVLSVDEGQVQVLGKNLRTLSLADRDRMRGRDVGSVFQNFNLLEPFSALENVQVGLFFAGLPSNDDRARDMLVRVGLEHRLQARPSTLSIGERQRVAVARALAPAPSLLLADEPTGSLDPATAESVCDLIQSLCDTEKTTLVCVTHDHRLISRFNHHLDGSTLIQEEVQS